GEGGGGGSGGWRVWVAAGGEKGGLKNGALSAPPLGRAVFSMGGGNFWGPPLPPPLQRFVGALKLLRRFHAWRNVGERRDDAAVRHGVRTHLHDQIAAVKTFQKRLAASDVTGKPFAHERLGGIFIRSALVGVEAPGVVEAGANPSELRRQCEDLAELAIPTDEMQLLVEYRDALANMIERGL